MPCYGLRAVRASAEPTGEAGLRLNGTASRAAATGAEPQRRVAEGRAETIELAHVEPAQCGLHTLSRLVERRYKRPIGDGYLVKASAPRAIALLQAHSLIKELGRARSTRCADLVESGQGHRLAGVSTQLEEDTGRNG